LKIVKDEEQGLDVPMICYHCEDAPCAAICPTKAITRASTGALVINYDSCIGCKICAVVCPYGAISINPDSRRVVKCDLCNGTPKCAQACPVDAIEYVKPQLFDVTARIDAARKIIKTHKLAS
jgi:Fe-S-cluster-containing hydrogenase component 2